MAVNRELILLYWRIGQEILKRKNELGWGSDVIRQLSNDLKHEFPEVKGFSSRNLVYMQTFASAYPDYEFTQQVAAQIPWFHNCVILEKVPDPQTRLWYLHKTIEQGWSRNVLVTHIEASSHLKIGTAQTNFATTLPQAHSDLAQQLIKNEYSFEFLGIGETVKERTLEKALIEHIRDFLLELGTGFAYLGNQYKLVVGDEDFFLDLLFYHVKLRCYMVIELKTGKFKPEHVGKLNFYLTAVDKSVKHPEDKPTIGLLLCQSSHHLVVEYSLAEIRNPMGVARYKTMTTELPQDYASCLPTQAQLQHLLATIPSKEKNDEEERGPLLTGT